MPPAFDARSVRFLLFDLDGTLITPGTDFKAMREDVRRMFVDAGVPEDFPFRHILGGTDDALAYLGERGWSAEDRAALRARAYHLIESREREGLGQARGIEGVPEALDAWRATHKVGIFTRTHPEVLRLSIGRFGLGRFDVLLSRDEGPPKPDPAQCRLALARAGVGPGEALAVGDHVFDVQSAKGAGVRSVGVLTGSGTREDLLREGASLVVGSVPELRAHL